jgi:hypothetical protein
LRGPLDQWVQPELGNQSDLVAEIQRELVGAILKELSICSDPDVGAAASRTLEETGGRG